MEKSLSSTIKSISPVGDSSTDPDDAKSKLWTPNGPDSTLSLEVKPADEPEMIILTAVPKEGQQKPAKLNDLFPRNIKNIQPNVQFKRTPEAAVESYTPPDGITPAVRFKTGLLFVKINPDLQNTFETGN